MTFVSPSGRSKGRNFIPIIFIGYVGKHLCVPPFPVLNALHTNIQHPLHLLTYDFAIFSTCLTHYLLSLIHHLQTTHFQLKVNILIIQVHELVIEFHAFLIEFSAFLIELSASPFHFSEYPFKIRNNPLQPFIFSMGHFDLLRQQLYTHGVKLHCVHPIVAVYKGWWWLFRRLP